MNWLFLRGLIREKRHWHQFPKVFEAIVPGSKVFLLDLPGVGDQINRNSPVTIRGIANDVRRRWLALKRENPGDWSVLSLSLGAMVTMDWVFRHPDDFRYFVMINSSAANVGHPFKRMTLGSIPKVALAGIMPSSLDREKLILSLVSQNHSELDDVLKEWDEYALTQKKLISVATRQLIAATVYRAPRKLPVPVLALSSLGDHFVNKECTEELARRFGAKLAVHPDAGHELTLDDPDWVAHQVKNWLQSQVNVKAG